MSFLKSIESFLRSAYPKWGKTPVLGYPLRLAKSLSRQSFFRGFNLRFFIFPEIKKVISALDGDLEKRKRYFQEAQKIYALCGKFGKWKSGDYDVMMLYLLTRFSRAETIVETGIASGRSSSAILEALESNKKGKLYSLDFPKVFREVRPSGYINLNAEERKALTSKGEETPGWLVPQNLRGSWVQVLGNSEVELPKLINSLSKIDIFFHDGHHTYENMMFEYDSAWPKIPTGGFLISDDVKANKAFDDFLKKVHPRFVHSYNGFGIIQK